MDKCDVRFLQFVGMSVYSRYLGIRGGVRMLHEYTCPTRHHYREKFVNHWE